MANLELDFLAAAPEYTGALEAYLSQASVPLVRTGASTTITVSSIEDCGRVGKVIAEFIASRPEVYELRIDGPGAECTLRRVHTPDDEGMIMSNLAAAADLL